MGLSLGDPLARLHQEREVFGHDAIQTLLLALQAIGSDLYTSAAQASEALTWSDAWAGYGFPVPGVMRDQLVGDDAKYL
jgi:hypothetical protein